MTDLRAYLADGYDVVSSHGGDALGHYLVLRKGTSVVLAKLPASAWTGTPKAGEAGRPMEFVVLS